MNIQLFKGPLTGSFKPSTPFLIVAGEFALDWKIVASSGPTTLEWYLEFGPSNQATGPWHQETAEEDNSKGVVLMPAVVRTFANNNSTTLSDGTWYFDTEFKRKAQFARVQMRVSAGAARVELVTPTGFKG